jgi:hypothetical protein
MRTLVVGDRRIRAILAPLLIVLAGCARRLAPVDVRSVARIIDVPGIGRETAYCRALIWFENHDKAGIGVTSRDPDTSTISASAELQCHSSVGAGLRAMGLGFNQNYLRCVVQFQAKDGRFRIAFGDLFYYIKDIRYPSSSLEQGPSNQAEVDALYRDCLRDLEASLAQAVGGGAASDF